ncbi:MAG: DPP IV N-terminal domain-containing protein [Candidatus Poribacteria bacterium]|nr:DPP IV N-terminal domain-containing protein [Candidatus Poribacteria bacterium]MDE0503097.1 DPP IV N-terminal domain-containing protein [Candidatus Poribacteria bacterium]
MSFRIGRTFSAALVMSLLIQIQIAENGYAGPRTKIAFTSTRGGDPDIYVMDADGRNPRKVTTHDEEDGNPTWSPDGRQIAFESNRNGGNIQIWVIDADGKNPVRLTDGVWDRHPSWSPDGKKIAYDVLLNPWDADKWNRTIYVMDSDGGNSRKLIKEPAYDTHPSWSPNSKKIAFSSSMEDGGVEIYVMQANGRNQKRLTYNFGDNRYPTWSPDGKRIAFVHDSQIYVMDSNGENQRKITEKRWNRYPTWSPDSGTIAFESWEKHGAEHGIFSINVRSGALRQISEVHKVGDFQPDWFNSAGLSVLTGGNRVTMWGRLKDVASSLR